ncbi:MAG: hypothetical protein GY814_12830 [Gammaproteobacteria bacterium]|nr:hypothetical protein [Gammaproteobacteria bacterium]
MSKITEINLKITSDNLRKFCQEVDVGSANTSRKHAAFMALEAFISRHAGTDAHTKAYCDIQGILEKFSVATRAQLLAENASTLASALNKQEIHLIARTFSSVSRNGFQQILTRAIDEMTGTQQNHIRQWIATWCSTAKQQAEEASGYPDTLDFRNTDIDLIEYTALSEINSLLMAR